MKHQQIRDVVHEHFKGLLERQRERALANGKLPSLDRQSFENRARNAAEALADYEHAPISIEPALLRFTERYSMPILPESPQFDMLRVEFLKAMRDYAHAVLKEDDALDAYDFSNAAQSSRPHRDKERKLATVINEYCDEKLRLKQWRTNTAKGYRAHFDLLLRILGEDASLHLSTDVASDVKDCLLRLPKNIAQNKSYREAKITDLMGLGLPESERLSVVTVANHMRTYSTFYEWAVGKKRTSENNFSAYVDNVKNALAARSTFSDEQTQSIFSKVLNAQKPHQKWGVLIAFYTGARLNEIAQLETHDIREVEGIWCIDINANGERKSLKNKSSERIIPIHSKLIELGFLEYAKQAGKGRLFSALTYHPKDGYGRNLGRWFNNSLLRSQLNITSSALVFHSIRHTVAKQLRNNKVQEATLKDILGHAQTGVTMSTYAKNLDKSVMQEAIETLHYA